MVLQWVWKTCVSGSLTRFTVDVARDDARVVEIGSLSRSSPPRGPTMAHCRGLEFGRPLHLDEGCSAGEGHAMSRDRQTLSGRALRELRPLLKRFDVRVSRWSKSYEYQRMRYMRDAGVVAIVDVGASVGQYGAGLRADGFRGRLLSIEPLGRAFRHLAGRSAHDPLWDCIQCGLGAQDGEARLNVSANGDSSSILPILDSHVDAAPGSRVQSTETIQVRTLDSVVGQLSDQRGAIGLKLDVQGYEAEVLRGASGTLPRVVFLEIELSLVPLYAGQALFIDVIEEVRALGFSLVNVDTGSVDPRTGRVLQCDGMFLRSQ